MDQFTYVADPQRSLRMHNSLYLERVRRADWDDARHIEELVHRLSAELSSRSAVDELLVPTRAGERGAWLAWRRVLQSLHLTASLR